MTTHRREVIELFLWAALALVAGLVAVAAHGQVVCAGPNCNRGRQAAPVQSDPPPPQAVRIVNTAPVYCLASGALVEWEGTALVLTCFHTFADGVGQILVCFPGGQPIAGKLLGIDQAADLAAISIGQVDVKPFPIAASPAMQGQTVRGGGFDGPSNQWAWIAGQCRGYVSTDRGKTYTSFVLAQPSRQGDSGGPVLNERGELCGVIWGADRRESVATYSGKIRSFLSRVAPKQEQAKPPGEKPAEKPTPPPSPPVETDPPDRETKRPPAEMKPPASETKPPEKPAADPSIQERLDHMVGMIANQADAAESQARATGALTERIAAVAEKIGQAEASAGASSIATAVLTGLGWTGPPAIALAALPYVIAALRRRREKKATAKAVSTGPVATSSGQNSRNGAFVPTDAQRDYVTYWADHFVKTGGNLQEEAAKGPLYVEALELLKDGRIAVQADPASIARGVEDFVHQQFAQRAGILPQCELQEAAYVGFLYRDGFQRLRTGLLKASGFGQTADVLHGFVARQFLLRVHRVPNVNFLPGDRT